MAKIAIATLLKGIGINFTQWKETLVIIRNQSIRQNFNGECDLIFFHEGDLHEEYMAKIKYSRLLNFNVKFIEVPNFRLSEGELSVLKPDILDMGNVRTGYSSMCRFWAYFFMEYLKEYDYVIRLDDDCIALTDINNVIENLEKTYLTFPHLGQEDLRHGLEDFMKMYFDKPVIDEKRVGVPYTNFCGFNLNKIRKDKRILNFFKEIENNQFIHKYAWTDTLLWGIIMKYLLKEGDWKEVREVKYIHLSHLTYVN